MALKTLEATLFQSSGRIAVGSFKISNQTGASIPFKARVNSAQSRQKEYKSSSFFHKFSSSGLAKEFHGTWCISRTVTSLASLAQPNTFLSKASPRVESLPRH